jgi:membrane-associated phospholipid phosphatase
MPEVKSTDPAVLGARLLVAFLLCAVIEWAVGPMVERLLAAEGLLRWDQAVTAGMYAHQTPAGDWVFGLVTLLGIPGTWIVGVVVAIVLWRRRAWNLLTAWVAAGGGSALLEYLLKLRVHRPRPPYAAAFLHRYSYSFPSGHVMASIVCYVMLAFVVTRLVAVDRRRAASLYMGAALLVAAVAGSRLYLAVHYPSDVIGAVAAGGAWVAICIAVVRSTSPGRHAD